MAEKLSAKQKILNHLERGNRMTTAFARNRFGIENVAARVDELRQEGHAIFTNTRTLPGGRKVYSYRLGTPPKSVVAAGLEYLRIVNGTNPLVDL